MASEIVRPVLVFVALTGACVWVGGLVAIVVVARIVRRQLEPPLRVAFFRTLGRSYLSVGLTALVLALAAGAGLLTYHRWDGVAVASVAVAVVLVLVLAAGVVQARAMTGLRRTLLKAPADTRLVEQVRRSARRATLLRAVIVVLSLTLLALAAVLAAP